jgi:hypothetical protein
MRSLNVLRPIAGTTRSSAQTTYAPAKHSCCQSKSEAGLLTALHTPSFNTPNASRVADLVRCRPQVAAGGDCSELGWQIAVDLEADANLDEGRGGPGHDHFLLLAPDTGSLGHYRSPLIRSNRKSCDFDKSFL